MNGVLAQGFWKGSLAHGAKADHPLSGLVSYFLPLRSGSVKLWASETDHFFCCHGSNVQANATHTGGIYYKAGSGLAIASSSSRRLSWDRGGEASTVEIRRVDFAGDTQRIDGVAPAHPAPPDRQAFEIHVSCPTPAEFPLSFRLPWWLAERLRLSVNGEALRVESKPSSFVEIERAWKDDRVRIELPKRLVSERLPGSRDMYAFMDGPDLLAGLCSEERILYCDDPAAPEGTSSPTTSGSGAGGRAATRLEARIRASASCRCATSDTSAIQCTFPSRRAAETESESAISST